MMASFGVMGLGVMGSSLCMNLAEKTGELVIGYDLDEQKCSLTIERARREEITNFAAYTKLEDFVHSLQVPRHVILLVPAGAPVEACLQDLGKFLEKGDVIMDGGNEWYENTERRANKLATLGILYIGCGVSGGAQGARHGPALMVGGPQSAWHDDKKTPTKLNLALHAIAARAKEDDVPCVVYCGTGGAGNYVKMVHNGIEYGDMQLIGEIYTILRTLGKFSNIKIAQLFESWSDSILHSFLIEITAAILRKKKNDQTDLIDVVLDKSGSKGTGKWTVQSAADKGIPMPTVAAALDARYLSARYADRQVLFPQGRGSETSSLQNEDQNKLSQLVFDALLCAKITSYAQGLALLAQAKKDHSWTELHLPQVLRCWRGGCIIRAKVLPLFADALEENPEIFNLILHPNVSQLIHQRQLAWRQTLSLAVAHGIPVPALSSSLAYYDTLCTPRLHSAALVQAQRDCFGGHTYRRTDLSEGMSFSSNWLDPSPEND
uniref:6-phosphogluconate dehydrogenase, decarboxylating n=1 Tax=Aureoumbra lagunensis TaxID=44058 RepID=A0A7S3JXD4_9STRA